MTGVLARLRALLTDRNLQIRLLSAFVLIPIVIAVVYAGGWWFAALIALGIVMAIREWGRMVLGDNWLTLTIIMGLAALVAFLGTAPMPVVPMAAILVLAAIVISALAIAVTRKPWGALIGVPYVLVPAVCLIWLRGHGDGFRLMMYLFFVVWGTDSGAYLVGRIVGGPKLAPQISPSKTWSGAIGGALIAAVTGLVVAMLHGTELPVIAFGVALLLAIATQLGDLFESALKRRYAIKDSGDAIPGHGGILDRVDGLLVASAVLALFHGLLLAMGYNWW